MFFFNLEKRKPKCRDKDKQNKNHFFLLSSFTKLKKNKEKTFSMTAQDSGGFSISGKNSNKIKFWFIHFLDDLS